MADRASRWWLGACVVFALVTATACAGIPTSGPIVVASPVDGQEGSPVRIEAGRPRPGASPTEIVDGFLDAMSSYEPGFPTAELFLTPAARDSWDRSAIEVYSRSTVVPVDLPAETGADVIVRLFGTRVARIDAGGRFSAAAADSPELQVPFRLAQDEDGAWRIATPPPALLISSFDLSTTYRPFTTYFPDPDGQVLVPDQIWLPAVEPQLAKLIAQAVVDGPTDLLATGVANPFPAGTLVGGATIAGDTVTVALTGQAIAATPDARRLMFAQLSATLSQALDPTVEAVEVTIAGQAIDVPDDSPDMAALLNYADPPAYVLTAGNQAIQLDPTGVAEPVQVPGPLGRGELAARSFAISLDRTTAATVTDLGNEVYHVPLADDGAPVKVFVGEDIDTPSFDRYGNLWFVDRTGQGSAVKVVLPGDVSPFTVAAPDLAGELVAGFRVAPDGVRVAVVTDSPGAPIRIGHIIRGADGAFGVELVAAIPFAGRVTDVAWASATELLVVATAPEGFQRPFSVSVDGSVITPGAVTGILSVAAFPARQALALTDANNILQQVSVLDWDQVADGSKAVAYPG